MKFKTYDTFGGTVYGLSTVQEMGGAEVFYFDCTRDERWMWPYKAKALAPLIEAQPYIQKVEIWEGQEVDGCVGFEVQPKIPNHGQSILTWVGSERLNFVQILYQLYGILDRYNVLKPWIFVEPKPVAEIVINKTLRYESNLPWQLLNKKGRAIFVGLEDEHQAFEAAYGKIPHYKTPDYLLLAQVIAGSKLFAGSQSSNYALAEGMKHNTLQDTYWHYSDCLFTRPNASFYKPELDLDQLVETYCSSSS